MARRMMGEAAFVGLMKNKSKDQDEELCDESSSIGSASVDSSSCFSDSNDDGDEASSSSSSSSSSSILIAKNMNDDESPLYQLSELMAQLPIKRGLSSFYQGKSQSFTSLGSVKSLEDLVKKLPSKRRKVMKPKCKSFCVGLERGKHCYGPKPAISKKGSSSRGSSCFSSLARTSGRTATCFE
ncbi:Protein OXIDATIVE STRESS 3 [Linum grandiflorum]